MVALAILLVFFATFLAAAVAVVISAVIFRRSVHAGDAVETGQPMLLRDETLSSISVWHELLTQVDLVGKLKLRLTEAGLKWSVGRVIATMLLFGALAAALVGDAAWLPPGTALLVGLGAATLPYLYINRRRAQRFAQMEEQFPDALDSLSRAMRAGHGFGAALEMLASETPAPLGAEFRKTCDEYKLGSPLPATLDNLSRRVPLLEIRLFAAAVTLQTKTGGKLTEVLERLADTIRDSVALRGDVRAISAHGRLTGAILTVMPIGIAILMFVTSPQYISVLIFNEHGPKLIFAALVCLVAGHLVIQRIVKIKI